MTVAQSFPRYGVREQTAVDSEVDAAVENLRLLGYAVVDGGYSGEELDQLSSAFDTAREAIFKRFGREELTAIDEHNTIRTLLALDPVFVGLAMNANVMEVCRRLIGGSFILNQQNGIINPPRSERYNQGSYHRDLPYQHFVSSRPLAINALFCLDAFTAENGATFVLPATHKQEPFPSDKAIENLRIQISAPRGSFIVLDCMLYHSGGVNQTSIPRRAVNHVYTIPLLKQQISLLTAIGSDFTTDPALRNLLGFEYEVPSSVEEYYADRRRRVS